MYFQRTFLIENTGTNHLFQSLDCKNKLGLFIMLNLTFKYYSSFNEEGALVVHLFMLGGASQAEQARK